MKRKLENTMNHVLDLINDCELEDADKVLSLCMSLNHICNVSKSLCVPTEINQKEGQGQ